MKVLFNDQEVQNLLDDYQKMIGVRIAVFDINFNELYSSPRTLSCFCQSIRTSPLMNDACKYCDQKAFRQAKANKKLYIYQCHMGLFEAISPIYDQQQILGYVMIGQMLGETDKNIQWRSLYQKHATIKPILDRSKDYFYQLNQMSVDEIKSGSRIMTACASYIWLQYLIDIERSPLTNRIKAYVATHYSEQLTTPQVCNDLNISKTTLYNYLKNEYNQSLSQYVNHIRLKKAAELLKTHPGSIADISQTVGFQDYNYFSKKFKATYGKTPTAYRKI